MAKIAAVTAGHYRIPLDVPLSDSTHGTMTAFELITMRVRDADGEEGMGYTYTTGHNGGAIYATLSKDIAEIVAGLDADRIEQVWNKVGGACTTAAEADRQCWPCLRSISRCGI